MDQVVIRDRFQYWLMEMDTAIKQFLNSLPTEVQRGLASSDETSLPLLEHFILSKYPNPRAAVAPSESVFLDGAARFLGEIFRTKTNAKWTIESGNSDAVFFGIPTLNGGSLQAPLCPLTMISAATDRRTGTYFSTILKNVSA
jgi:hypothetical protein